MEPELRARLLEFIQNHGTLTLATLREDGWPQATTVAYASAGMTIYVATGADAQKVRNIRACEKVSLTIDSGYADWSALQGISMAAVARVIESASERQQAARMLNRKFPELAEFSDPEHDRGWAFLRIEPKVLSWIDYTRGFGHTVLVRL